MSDNINNAITYVKTISNMDLTVKVLEKELMKRLPIVIASTYECYQADLKISDDMTIDLMLLEPVDSANCTPVKLQKHQQLVTNAVGMHTVFVLDSLAAYNVTRLPAARVNYIIPGRQIFIPSLLIELKKISFGFPDENAPMPPLAQLILLMQLNGITMEGKDSEQIRWDLYTPSYSNIRRAINWLIANKIIQMVGGKNKTIEFLAHGRELWELVLPQMPSPIERLYYTDEEPDNPLNRLSGETALGELTMLAPPEGITFAVDKVWAAGHSRVLDKQYGRNTVEVWRYSPWLLSNDKNTVDPLSLYLCLRDKEDERIQIELEKLINDFVW